MLNQVVLDMNNQLTEAKKQVAASIADEKRLAKQLEQETANAGRVGAARDDGAPRGQRGAREGGARAEEGARRSSPTTYQDQWTKQKAAVEQLKKALRMLNDKIEEAKRKKNVLIARKKRAEAQKRDPGDDERAQGCRARSRRSTGWPSKIDQIEAEAEAGAELPEEYTGDVLASQFQQLEKTHGADDDLVALKRKMGMLPPEEPKVGARRSQARVEAAAPATAAASSQAEQEELAAALEEMEAEQPAASAAEESGSVT